MDNENEKKVILITGASRGLGKELCIHFANLGMKVIGFSRSGEKLAELKSDIFKNNGDFSYYVMDVKDYEGIKSAVDDVSNKYGPIDILINNAGVGKLTALEDLSQEDIDSQIDTNLKGTIYFTRFVAPVMMAAKKGFIFNISSTAATRGLKSNGLYFATKHGINGFADSISKYLIDYNIHVVTLCPGGIDTPWWDGDEWKWPAEKNDMIKPSDIAKLIEFILNSRQQILYKSVIFFPTCETNDW